MSSFTFKQFTIQQSNTAMKVGTDGVLLGAWTPICNTPQPLLLDIGTGTGLIALMLAQRIPHAYIHAIEIDHDAYTQATENCLKSPFSSRITLHHTPLQSYETTEPFHAIACNPPYFIDSLKSPDKSRTTARHTDSLSFTELLAHSQRLLTPEGNLSVILPTTEAAQLLALAPQYNFHPNRITHIHPTPNAPIKRQLINLIQSTEPIKIEENELTIEISRHQYTPEYIALTRDFYLKM